MSYGPDLTPKQMKKLKQEIANFDVAKTKKIIEKNAVGRPDIDLSQDDVSYDNVDNYSDENVMQWGRASMPDMDVALAQIQIRRILTPKQWKIWQLVMQQSMTQENAAKALRMDQGNLAHSLKLAKERVVEHFSK